MSAPEEPATSAVPDRDDQREATGELPVQLPHPQPARGYTEHDVAQLDPDAPTSGDKNLAMLAHFGTFVAAWFFLGIVAPIITYVIGGERPFVRHHSKQSINLSLTTYLLIVMAGIASVVAMVTGIASVAGVGPDQPRVNASLAVLTGAMVLAVAAGALLWVFYYLIATLRDGFAAMDGRPYHFRLCLPILGRHER